MSDEVNALLAERYSIKPAGSGSSKKIRNRVLGGLAVFALTITAGIFGLANYNPITFADVGYRVVDQWSVEVDFEVTKPTDRAAICSVQALNSSYAVVGWKEFEIAPADTQSNRYTVRINTISLAVTGLVEGCRLK